jgi:hypothetical protein
MVVIVYVDMMVRVGKVETHNDGENEDTESKYHSSHPPALGLLGGLLCSTVVSQPVQSMYLHTSR